MTQAEVWDLLLKAAGLFGGIGALTVAAAAFVSKLVADRSIESHKAELGRETEKLKGELAKKTETHKLNLKKREILFQKEIEAASAFIALHRTIEPELNPRVLWEEAMVAAALDLAGIEQKLRDYVAMFGAALSSENRREIDVCMILAARHKFADQKDAQAIDKAAVVAHDVLTSLGEIERRFLDELRS
ncbi:hypothetical protein HU230_0036835 [Bradyrhizobium quebecense]|uniref:Uncharacterized protein n=1 Tax=Bradyrhizobium quebecense TaxID=2748629 RepID=A0A973WXA3_9BRAD|nr:hypothetical protein [Bradyrhizobium quebecense]UGA43756.1 hypothetical protein HU230_0036835 [Bradyrhizobium quebecense]